jgi:hypothetical protein
MAKAVRRSASPDRVIRERTMRKCAALAFMLLIGAPGAAFAQQSHSAEDEAACTPDVMRLCQQFIPNRDAIVGCLVKNRKQMSPECSRVFARPTTRRSKPAVHQAFGQ